MYKIVMSDNILYGRVPPRHNKESVLITADCVLGDRLRTVMGRDMQSVFTT